MVEMAERFLARLPDDSFDVTACARPGMDDPVRPAEAAPAA
jgi:alginate O-acetyltransferase complex protein AlgJ